MSDDRRQAIQAALTVIAAKVAYYKADRVLKQCGSSPATVARVLDGCDHRISTLLEIADALGCDVEITIHKRSA